MKESIIYAVIVITVTVAVWGIGKMVSDTFSDYEVIHPRPGIECVVVSRMFNTSVDCNWD
jgi:hypothetical protein